MGIPGWGVDRRVYVWDAVPAMQISLGGTELRLQGIVARDTEGMSETISMYVGEVLLEV